jgi:phosphate transport system substrate-binding protein
MLLHVKNKNEIGGETMRKVLFAGLVLALLLAGCGAAQPTPTAVPTSVPRPAPTATAAGLSGHISVAGSTTVQPLAEKLSEAFTAANPNVSIDVVGGGSSVGVKSAGEGTVDIGAASREISADELTTYPDLKIFNIARDGIAVIANPNVTVNGLTKDQVRSIFSGAVTNWKDVGGPDKAIVVVSREEGSGTRAAFEELVMGKDALITDRAILQPSNGALLTTVSTTPDSIGFLSFGYLDSSVKALAIDGVAATEANALNGTYPVVRPLNMLTHGEPTGVVKAWLDFILGSEGQKIVSAEGYLSVK